jgi:hypothetical protein
MTIYKERELLSQDSISCLTMNCFKFYQKLKTLQEYSPILRNVSKAYRNLNLTKAKKYTECILLKTNMLSFYQLLIQMQQTEM